MKGITHAYEIKAFQTEKILTGELHKVIVKGYNTYPLYGVNEEIISLVNNNDEEVGYIAVKGFLVAPAEDISQEIIKECGLTKDEFNLYTQDSPIITIVDIIPVLRDNEDCACECNCDCDDEHHPCQHGEACQCGGTCKVAAE